MIRANQKGPIETVEPAAGNSAACNVEACTEMSEVRVEAGAERLDEAEIA